MTTRNALIGYRKDLADLRTARRILQDQQLPWRDVGREILNLANRVVGVDVPCVACGQLYPVPTCVDDPENTVPTAVLCADCDAQINPRTTGERR